MTQSSRFVSTVARVNGIRGTKTIRPNRATNRLGKIESALTTANDQYSTGDFTDAIASYKQVQSLIYQFLRPRHKPEVYASDDRIVLPVGRDIETKLAEASLRLAETIHPDITSSPPPIRVFGVAGDDPLGRFETLGFTDTGKAGDVGTNIDLGVELLADRKPREAIEALSAAMDQLDDPQTDEERSTAAAVALNLSAAHLLTGNQEEARKIAEVAERRFDETGDEVGKSQAKHNLGVAFVRSGDEDRGASVLSESSEMFRTVERDWRGRSRRRVVTADAVDGDVRNIQPSDVTPIFRRFPPSDTGDEQGDVLTTPTIPEIEMPPDVIRPDSDIETLEFIRDRDDWTLAVKWPGSDGGWSGIPFPTLPEEKERTQSWELGVTVGSDVVSIAWKNGKRPEASKLLDLVYEPRISSEDIGDLALRIADPGEIAAYLTHLYAFVVPQSLGDCYHELGKYARAEEQYLAASEYSYLNRRFEAPALWVKLAENAVAWGDHEYREEEIETCTEIYRKLVTEDGEVPEDSPLYAREAFSDVADDVRRAMEHIREGDLTDEEGEAEPLSDFDPDIARPLTTAWARWQHLNAGLDYYGLTTTPIFTFQYLQTVARRFAERAINAEREFVNFESQAKADAATRRELETAATLAEAETDVQREQYNAAAAEYRATERAVDLAETRSQNAREDLDNYRSAGWWQYRMQSVATGHGAHENWYESEIRELASDMERGEWEGEHGKLAAAATYLSGKKSYEYQLDRHRNNLEEMEAMVPVAREQAQAAEHRRTAARHAWSASRQRARMAREALRAFDDELFTSQLWRRMSQVMRELARDYKETAIRVAKLMERAYNFETDNDLQVIRTEYNPGATEGLLGADYLLRDIESFTAHRVTSLQQKETEVKDIVSLATEYPLAFYEFRDTGRLNFETALRDFDRRHPGLYGQRIHAIEVEVVGLLPPAGVTGTLRAGGISRYRTADGGERTRTHTVDTMALSEFELREDVYVYRADPSILGVFEGHGVATTWNLSLPKRSNDLPYDRIADVRLVLYYSAMYEPDLEAAVENREPLPGELVGVRDFRLRYDNPEAWYAFLDGGDLTYTLAREDMPYTETNFKVENVAIRLLAEEDVDDLSKVAVTLTLPDRDPVTLETDADGEVTSEADELTAVLGGDLLGTWSIEISPSPDGALADDGGELQRDQLADVAVVVEYGYDWPE